MRLYLEWSVKIALIMFIWGGYLFLACVVLALIWTVISMVYHKLTGRNES